MHLASKGYKVFPLLPNSKKPSINDFPNVATTDIETITKWWMDPVMGLVRDNNIGISTSSFGEDEALLVVDVDNKDGLSTGDNSVFELEMSGKNLPKTETQTTPTKGQHLIYRVPEAVSQSVNKIADKIDIRSKGGYIVAVGSTIDGAPYSMCEGEIELAPSWLIDECGKAPEKKEKIEVDVDQESACARAIHYLEDEAPMSVKGDGGDATAYQVAARVKDFGVNEANCLELMMVHWFEGSGWTAEKLEVKIHNAYHYGQESVGAAAPEAVFEEVEDEEGERFYLDKMNDNHALIYVGSSHFILYETTDAKGRESVVFLSEKSFRIKYSPFKVQQENGPPKTYATAWLNWKGRREYKGVCFSPEKETREGYYNLWKGYTVEPLGYNHGTTRQQMGLELFKTHVMENVCEGNADHYNYVMGYFAQMIQKPWERPRTALVFRGEKGVGKNAMVDRIGYLLGSGHYLVAHEPRYLTSNFNGHLDKCLLMVLDEAFWSGDKKAEGKLKGLITAPEIMIEHKGKEPYVVDNLVRLIIIGNEDWLVPASHDERRYAVFNVGDGKKKDTEFFETMRQILDNEGGNRLLLDYLLNFDLSQLDLDVIPNTEALRDQKEDSLDPIHEWWFNCLKEGKIVGVDIANEWPMEITAERVRLAATNYIKSMGHRWVPKESVFGRTWKKSITLRKRRKMDGGSRFYFYILPSLEEAREMWDNFMGHKTNWDDDE